jgi:SAM-dependent methyltransferase
VTDLSDFDDPAFYGDCWAEVYDELHAWLEPTAAVEFLARLAGSGRVLELGIGTGRVALPLSQRGIAVEGLDASQAMVNRLRAKPGGQAIPVTIGDMAQVPVAGQFQLVYLVFNSLFALLSQARQIRCFRNVARALEPGGVFVIECFVPGQARSDQDQRVTTQIVTLDEHGVHLRPVTLLHAWPGELDLMAAHAGLQLSERYADWTRRPFGPESDGHVSVYQRI